MVRGLLVVVPGHVDLGLGEPVVLVHPVPLALQPLDVPLRLLHLGVVGRDLLLALGQLALQLRAAAGIHLALRVLDLFLGDRGLQIGEGLLVLLPLAVVVRPDHEREHDEQADGGGGEEDVQLLGPLHHRGVAAGLVLDCHLRC